MARCGNSGFPAAFLGALCLAGCGSDHHLANRPTAEAVAPAEAEAAPPPPTDSSSPPPADTAEAQLVQLEKDYAKALIGKDRAFLMDYYAPDWRGGNWLGFWTKSTMLEAILSDRYQTKSMDLGKLTVRVLGDVAVVQGVDDEVTRVNGSDTAGRWSFTDVFAWRDGRWVAIASHTSEIAPKS